MTLPLRLMILHFSHMGFTDGLTFMINLLVNALMALAPPCKRHAVSRVARPATEQVVYIFFGALLTWFSR